MAENAGSKQRIRVIPELAVCLRVRSGSEVEWWAHNPQVAGSKPASENSFCPCGSLHALLLLLVSLLLHQYWHPELPCSATSVVQKHLFYTTFIGIFLIYWKQAQTHRLCDTAPALTHQSCRASSSVPRLGPGSWLQLLQTRRQPAPQCLGMWSPRTPAALRVMQDAASIRFPLREAWCRSRPTTLLQSWMM